MCLTWRRIVTYDRTCLATVQWVRQIITSPRLIESDHRTVHFKGATQSEMSFVIAVNTAVCESTQIIKSYTIRRTWFVARRWVRQSAKISVVFAINANELRDKILFKADPFKWYTTRTPRSNWLPGLQLFENEYTLGSNLFSPVDGALFLVRFFQLMLVIVTNQVRGQKKKLIVRK